jgi:hypothetical protein
MNTILPDAKRFSHFCFLPSKLLVGFPELIQDEAKSILGDHLCIDQGI